MGLGLVVAGEHGEVVGVPVGHLTGLGGDGGRTRAHQDEPGSDRLQVRNQFQGQVDALLLYEPGHHADDRPPVGRQPGPAQQLPATRLLAGQVPVTEVGRQHGIVGRMPQTEVDTVAYSAEVAAPSRQPVVEATTAGLAQHLGGVRLGHHDHPIGQADAAGQGIEATPFGEGRAVDAEPVDPGRIGLALVGQVVDGQHGRHVLRQQGDGRTAVPVVAVHDVGPQVPSQGGHGGAEGQEPMVVVEPRISGGGIDVGVGSLRAVIAEQDQLAGLGRPPGAHRHRRCPRRHPGQRSLDGVVEFDESVVGHDHVDLDSGRPEATHQATRGFAQATDLDQRGILGGGEQNSCRLTTGSKIDVLEIVLQVADEFRESHELQSEARSGS